MPLPEQDKYWMVDFDHHSAERLCLSLGSGVGPACQWRQQLSHLPFFHTT